MKNTYVYRLQTRHTKPIKLMGEKSKTKNKRTKNVIIPEATCVKSLKRTPQYSDNYNFLTSQKLSIYFRLIILRI